MKFQYSIGSLVFLFLALSLAQSQYQNIRISPLDKTHDHSEVAIAVSPLNSNNLMAVWNENYVSSGLYYDKPGYGFSTNAGINWSTSLLFPGGGDCLSGWDPSACFDRFGNAFYCYIYRNTSCIRYPQISRTTDFGGTWHDTAISMTQNTADKPFMAIDNNPSDSLDGRIYVAWTSYPKGNVSKIMFAFSNDHGTTFSSPQELASSTNNSDTTQFPPDGEQNVENVLPYVDVAMPVVGPNGDVYVSWMKSDNSGLNGGSVMIRKSTDGGRNFQASITCAPYTDFWDKTISGVRICNNPWLSVGPDGRLCVVYIDHASQTNKNYRTKFVSSSDGGNSWTTPPSTVWEQGNGWQFFPAITVDATGRITVAFMSTPDTTYIDAYLVSSINSGVTWGAPRKITTQNSNPYNRTTPILRFFGADYMDVVSNGLTNESYVVWTDYRDSTGSAYFSHSNTPSAPLLSCPHNLDSVGTSPILSWNASSGANSYGLQVATDSLFGSLTVNVTGITSLSYNASGLSANSTYYWRVNASDTEGTSTWSSFSGFIAAPPRAPNLTAHGEAPLEVSQPTGNSVKQLSGHQMSLSPPPYPWLIWTNSGCGVTYGVYRYYCTIRHGCTDTVGSCIYSGTDTSYIDSTWIVGMDSSTTAHYYVKATAGGLSSFSNRIYYGTGQDQQKAGLVGRLEIPKEYTLLQAYPNPFNPAATIEYQLPSISKVSLKVYNLLGQVVQVLKDDVEGPGYKEVQWNASSVGSGVYLYIMESSSISDPAKTFREVRKMVLIK